MICCFKIKVWLLCVVSLQWWISQHLWHRGHPEVSLLTFGFRDLLPTQQSWVMLIVWLITKQQLANSTVEIIVISCHFWIFCDLISKHLAKTQKERVTPRAMSLEKNGWGPFHQIHQAGPLLQVLQVPPQIGRFLVKAISEDLNLGWRFDSIRVFGWTRPQVTPSSAPASPFCTYTGGSIGQKKWTIWSQLSEHLDSEICLAMFGILWPMLQ